jgi:predicted DCC family thiol-disulfide oxidoreductase YuxK
MITLSALKPVFERAEAWIEPLTHERNLVGASVFRVVTGIVLLYQYLIVYAQRHYIYGPQGIWPFDNYLAQVSATGSMSLYALSDSPFYFDLIYHAGIIATMVWVLGWRPRLMTIVTYVFMWSLRDRNNLLSDGGDNLFQLVLVYAMFMNLGGYLSVDPIRVTEPGVRSPIRKALGLIHNAALLAIAIQVCLVYAVAGLYKVQGEMWQNGTALYYIMRVDEFTLPGYSELIYRNAFLVLAMTYSSVLFQIAFPFLFFLRRWTRAIALMWAFTFHLGIAVFMGLVTFAGFMIGIESALLSDRFYLGVREKLRRINVRDRVAPMLRAMRLTVFFDGWCPVCHKTRTLFECLDWFGVLSFVSFRDPQVVFAAQLDLARAEERIQVINATGKKLEGARAMAAMCVRVPMLAPVAPFIAVANGLGFGDRLYDWLASRRVIVAVNCDDSCLAPPTHRAR